MPFVEALSSIRGSIDGITTFDDYYVVKAAEAARKMGLPANPVEALELCNDKRKLHGPMATDMMLTVSDVADFEAHLSHRSSPWEYPMVIKPVVRCASDGVRQIMCEAELLPALQRHGADFPGIALLEPYAAGPEVDVIVVLWEDQNILSEVVNDLTSSDDAPMPAQVAGSALPAVSLSFAETSVILPTVLPAEERARCSHP